MRYSELSPQFRSPWESVHDLAEAISLAMTGADAFVLAPELQTKHVTNTSIARYERFMYLLKSTRTADKLQVLAPTADIDLCWRTHRIMPSQYRTWCAENLGRNVEDDETGSYHVFKGGCEELTATEQIWEKRYKEQYIQTKKTFLERMFGLCGKSAQKAMSKKLRGKPTGIDIPKFEYDPAAYSAAAPLSQVGTGDSSVIVPTLMVNKMPKRYTTDGTMLPVQLRKPRGSFVPTVVGHATPAMSNTEKLRKSSRHTKRVSGKLYMPLPAWPPHPR